MVGAPELASRVKTFAGLPLLSNVHVAGVFVSVSPNRRSPALCDASRWTVRSDVKSSVPKSAIASVPFGAVPSFQFAPVVQEPLLELVHTFARELPAAKRHIANKS